MEVATRWIERGRPKRALDLLLALPAIVLLAPLGVVAAALVRMRLGTPVLFKQERAGLAARPILVPKFRSMSDQRDSDGELLPDELRLTSFGETLRSSSLDELPQLWSVIRGDMSLVGPRPLPMAYVERYSSEQRRRMEAKPGITGWAQVNGRNALSWPEKLDLDVWYVEHASLGVDLKILAMTLKRLVRPVGVSAEGHATMAEFMGET